MNVIGWREWVSLPELGIDWTKAKVDTGARTSALDAVNIEYFKKYGQDWLRFKIHPIQRVQSHGVVTQAALLEMRNITSSNGKTEKRPVILTAIRIGEKTWPIELTLTDRDTMGFRMLLGRQGIPKGIVVNPHGSFLTSKPSTQELDLLKKKHAKH